MKITAFNAIRAQYIIYFSNNSNSLQPPTLTDFM